MAERKTRPVWRLTVRLAGVMPIVWRTILIRPETKLSMLHRYVQAAMGWRDHHSFSFTIGGRRYGIPDRERPAETKIADARRYTLARLFPQLPAGCEYLYDFGDQWEHRIDIEGAQEAEFRKQYPICIDGGEPCPPEDCGGPPGYRELRAVLSDPRHPRYAETNTWFESRRSAGDFHPQTATWTMRDAQRGYF